MHQKKNHVKNIFFRAFQAMGNPGKICICIEFTALLILIVMTYDKCININSNLK